ncbi:Os05g0353000 [Oryza sativa Japonica Group]|uniref:Os05g0353000 protein n=1 Tax=Oryza sativa subsp. japonica TaxID=39947 RepID=A0A0P0WL44_ORYSJ|nr:Os05g0353000 [Oryza sativa Japonica Group]
MCLGVPELRLSSAEANARLRRIVFEVPSSGFYLPPPPNNHHPSPCWSQATTHLSRDSASGVLFACMHGHSCSQWCSRVCSGVATYSISQLLEILLPIPTVWLTCDHDVDVAQMRGELPCNDVVV